MAQLLQASVVTDDKGSILSTHKVARRSEVFWPPQILHTHGTQTCMQAEHPYRLLKKLLV